jgi:polysaccharide pyruvyl transferase WcaK-like protein
MRVKELQHQVYLQPTCVGDSFLDDVAKETDTPILPLNMAILTGAIVLANAELMISGRFHPSILASLGGTPCIFLGSNSHKTKSLQAMLDYEKPKEYSAIPNQHDIESILLDAKYILANKKKIREKICNTVRLRAAEANELKTFIS